MELTGQSIIGNERSHSKGGIFCAFNPVTGEELSPAYFSAGREDIERAVGTAAEASLVYARTSGREKAAFLRRIAEKLESLGDVLIERATQETALPAARVKSETGRTCFQLRLFADLVEEGSWVDARIDHSDPHRKPAPKPDVRSMLRPLGPIVVFGASNFPIAFSVAGGDTASALAAGNPVVVKAHPAHPGTSELVGLAVADAVKDCHLPEGVFSLLFDQGHEVGTSLVMHPQIKAVGFTGSKAGGDALRAAVAKRSEPIPLYAEMGSVNPVFILPGALRTNLDGIAKGLHASVTVGAGQFCTNPGLVILEDSSEATTLAEQLTALMDSSQEFIMLSRGIRAAYQSGIEERARQTGVRTAIRKDVAADLSGCRSNAALFITDAPTFLLQPQLSSEIFGPTTLLVTCSNRKQLVEVARTLEGHLTATVQGTEDDLRANGDLLAVLETKVGRIILNGFPTGVEVCHAMVHGGPYPATSDERTTSVGTRAILRFARPVCFQDFPNHALPDELKNENPPGIWRLMDGEWMK